MILMILLKSGQKILGMGIMMTDMTMLMITGKRSMMIKENIGCRILQIKKMCYNEKKWQWIKETQSQY